LTFQGARAVPARLGLWDSARAGWGGPCGCRGFCGCCRGWFRAHAFPASLNDRSVFRLDGLL